MDRETGAPVERPGMEGLGAELVEFVQQQVQSVIQSAIPHIVQQISGRMTVPPAMMDPLMQEEIAERDRRGFTSGGSFGSDHREAKVATPEKFAGKKGGEVYRWFAQLHLVF